MIFLSHTQSDKPIVEPIANRLADVYGRDKVFYDSWSIQSGEGIIEKIDQGLSELNILFFFVSTDSLKSNMVKLEWQNALFKASQGKIKIIPVKLDDCTVPSVLTQTLYLNIFKNGFEVVLRQMIDIIEGKNIYQSEFNKFNNTTAYMKKVSDKEMIFEIRAERYMEPISRYGIVVANKEDRIKWRCKSDPLSLTGFNKDAATFQTDIGIIKANVLAVTVQRATVPGFPVEIHVSSEDPIIFFGVLKANSDHNYSSIPVENL